MTTGSCQWKIGLFIWLQFKIILYRINWRNAIIYEYDERIIVTIIVTSDFILIGFSRKTTQHTKSLLHVVEPLIITYRCFRCFPKAGINYSESAFVARRGNQWLVKAAGDKISRPGSVGGQGPVNDCPRRAERTASRHAPPCRGIRPGDRVVADGIFAGTLEAVSKLKTYSISGSVPEALITVAGRKGKVMSQPWRKASHPLSMSWTHDQVSSFLFQ